MLTCPVCAGRLAGPDSGSLRCPRGHCFDLASEGYVNLLVGGVRGAVGDTNEMLRARRTFLERGFYAPLSEQLNALALEYLTPSPSPRGEREVEPSPAAMVLDSGCGEGYYLGRLRAALETRLGAGTLAYLGVDIAKDAARLAARRYPDIRFAVADVKRGIPVESGSVALLLNVFAPRNPVEFARVVAPGGVLLVALPGPRHLVELRERYSLLGIEPEKAQHVQAQFEEAFTLAQSAELTYAMDLSTDDIYQLLTMTPNARHRERQGWRAATPEPGRVTASFVALAFRRKP